MNTLTDLIQLVRDLEHDLVWELQHGSAEGFATNAVLLRTAQFELLRMSNVTQLPLNAIRICSTSNK